MSSDKDVEGCVRTLVGSQFPVRPEHIYCVQANHPRALPSDSLREIITQAYCRTNPGGAGAGGARVIPCSDIKDNIVQTYKHVWDDIARDHAAPAGAGGREVVVVFGSTYILSDIRSLLVSSTAVDDFVYYDEAKPISI